MSQNAHSLMLFFDDEAQHKNCLLMLLKLSNDEEEQAQTWAQRLGVDLSEEWNEHWFNHQFKAHPEFLKLDYETSSHYGPPLVALRQLFSKGLKAAVLEIFHDQVGEYSRYHFLDNKLVNHHDFYMARPQVRELVATEIPTGDDYNVSPQKPVTLSELIDKAQKSQEEAQDLGKNLLDLYLLAKESGSNPIELAKSVLLLRALGIGLLQASLFTLITVLLFKGFWLWIGLGALLAVVLPLLYANRVIKDFSDNEENNDAD